MSATVGCGEGADSLSAIADLGNVDSTARAAAAAALREAPPQDDHGEAYWRERLARVQAGMARDRVAEILPPVERMTMPSKTEIWQLDGYWAVALVFADDAKVEGTPVLEQRVRSVWVDPPPGFSGTWVTFYVNGQKSHEIGYRDGTYDGVFLSYHDNGERSVEQHYVAGQISGSDMGWYRSGHRRYAGRYVDGVQHGTWEHWYDDGQLQAREVFDKGVPTATWSTWFPDGRLQYEVHYRGGVKHGLDRAWDESGTLLWSREYVDGQLAP